MRKLLYLLTCWIPIRFLMTLFYAILRVRAEYTNQSKSLLSALMQLDNRLYGLQGFLSIRYGKGVHSKHRHMHYHDFFAQHLKDNQQVLEIGCGYGALANGIVLRKDVQIDAIDIVEKNIQKAKDLFQNDAIHFIYGDALTYTFDKTYDAVVMSNVLEHIEHRVDFLKKITSAVQPKKYIIRVPMFERDWRVPLKKELGVDWRLDPTHYTEYTVDQFKKEFAEAGLRVDSLSCVWGEIWATAVPVEKNAA